MTARRTRLLFPEKLVEPIHARLAPVLAPEPDRAAPFQVADHDAIRVPLADRDLIDANDLRSWSARPPELFAHVIHFQPLDRLPIQVQLYGHVLDRTAVATPTHVSREALGVQRVLQQKLQSLGLHAATAPTLDAPHLEVEVDAVIGAGQIPNPTGSAIVPSAVWGAALPADRFFPRRTRVTRRARGSPNSPCTRSSGRKPGKVDASARRRRLGAWAIRTSCQVSPPSQHRPNPVEIGLTP